MEFKSGSFFGPNHLARRVLAGIVAFVYGITNVAFGHAAESNFWSSRRTVARQMSKSSAAPAPASTDALILAQLPGGARLDFQRPVESSVVPTVAPTEHLVGGKIPVFESDLPRWLADVIAPYGNMRDVFLSKRPGAPLVIQIQDLHDSTEAQQNIAGLVTALQDERGVNLVGLEGAQGAFATEAFRSFPDADITKAVADHFMEQGYLGGPEFAGITAKRMPLLWGVEDMNGYAANVEAVKHAAKNRPVMDRFLQEARRVMNEVKDRRLSVKLLEFDRHLTGYHGGKEPLGTYVRYLLKSSPLSPAHVPNLVLLRDALRWEEMLDFKRIERERANLLERMVQRLSKENLDRLVARSASYRLGRVTYGEYYRFLRTLCMESGISLDDYGQLSAYVRYVLLAERINRNDLLTELGALERAVQDSLAVTAEEKRIVSSARNLALLERLVRHAYTPADWAYQTTHAEEIRNVGVAIVTLAQQVGVPHTLSPPGMDVLAPYEDFCRQAVGRNAAMVQNLLAKMQTEKRNTAVLVAGGFHTEGLTQLLRQKDISYAVVTPKVNGPLPEGQRSLDLLARDPAPLEKLFAGETVNIPTERIVAEGGSDWGDPLRRAFAILLLSIFVGASNNPVKPQDLSGVSAASIARVESSGAVRKGEGVIQVTFNVRGTEKAYWAENVQETGVLSSDGSMKIHPGKIKVTAVPDARSFREQLHIWGNSFSNGFANVRSTIASINFSKISGIWNRTVAVFSSSKPTGGRTPWESLLVLVGLGGIVKRVRSNSSLSPVNPVRPVAQNRTSTDAQAPEITTVLSEMGPLLSALDELSKDLPDVGLDGLIQWITEQKLLPKLSDPLRQKVIEALLKEFGGPIQSKGNITAEMMEKMVNRLRLESSSSHRLYDLQKPATYKLLNDWKNNVEKTIIGSIKRFLGRHDILGTAIVEELGLFEQENTKFLALLEGRVPMVVVGTMFGGLMLLVPTHSLVIVLSGLAIGLVWTFLRPQRHFVRDHGPDQTRLQIGVRTGGTFILNLVALSVSWTVVLAGVGFGFDAKFFILLIVSPAVALIAAIFTHAFFEILDILPDSTPAQKDNFPEETPGTDPLGIPPTKEAEADALKAKLAGKTIGELNKIIRVVADHDLGGSVNDLAGKHTIGVLGESQSVHIVGASKNFSPYWWQRRWIRDGVKKNKDEIIKGPGGDDYKMFFDKDSLTKEGKSVESSLSEIVDEENQVMRDQFVLYSVESPEFRGDESREKEFLDAIKNKFRNELDQEGRIIIVRHGDGVTIAVKKNSPDEKMASIEARLSRLGAGSRWRRLDQTRPGLGLFSYSMGGLRMGDLVQRLLEADPNLKLLDSDGKLLEKMVPVVMTWADRLAEDMLSVAKGRGRKQVFVADALETIKTYERPGTVTKENINQTISGENGEVRPAFSVPMADEFWKAAKLQGDGHVVVFEVAQYRTQDLRWRVNATSEWILRHVPRFLFKAVPERWVRSLEKRIQSRAFHAWQGSDQHGKGNDAIAAHYEMVVGLVEEGTTFGRAVDTFFAHSRAPPSINKLSSAADAMKGKLKSQHQNETKIDPFHVVYDLNLAEWTGFLKERPGMYIEDVLAMQNAVVTYLGRRYGEEPLIEKLREIFTVERGTNVLLLSMDVTTSDAAHKFRKLELLFRKAQAENARAAELVLNARPPIRMGSFAFSWLAKGVEKVFKVSPARARQIVSGRYVQSFIVSALELPFLPYLAMGLTIAMGSFLGPWGAILAASIIMALIHGKPVMTRGPPEALEFKKDEFGRPIENLQTLKQFTIRLLAALAINTFALTVGGLDPTLLFNSSPHVIEYLDLMNTGATGYFSHALYNFVVPESYRLSFAPVRVKRTRRAASPLVEALNRNEKRIRELSVNDPSLFRLLTAYSHHNENVNLSELDELFQFYRKVDELGAPAIVGIAKELAVSVAEWGADRTTLLTALLGGIAIQNGSFAIPKEMSDRLALDQTVRSEVNQMYQRVGNAWRAPISVENLTVSSIRNQMGVILTGGLITGEKDDHAFLLMLMGKVISLKHASDPSRKNNLAKELEFLFAPMAERFGQDALSTEILDQAFLISHPESYALRHADFIRATGKKHEAAQEALEDLRAHFEARLLDRLGPSYAGLKVIARVKGIASISEKKHRYGKDVDSFTDLFGITVIFPEGKDRNDALVLELLKEYGAADHIYTGINSPLTKDYEFFRTIIRDNASLSPEGRPQSIEVQVYDHSTWIQSKTGDAAHWLYHIQKRRGHQIAQVDRVHVSGNLATDLFEFVNDKDRKKFVYVTVRVGENQFVPLRLPRGAIPADAAAHRRVGLLTQKYNGMGVLTFQADPANPWKLTSLSEKSELLPGMILSPNPEQIGRETGIHLSVASLIVPHATRPRTVLMTEVASKGGAEEETLKLLANEGRTLIRSRLAQNGKGLEWLDGFLREPDEGKLFTLIKRIRGYFADGGGVPAEIEQNLLTPLARDWGLNGPEEIFSYMAVLNEGTEVYTDAMDIVVSRLTEDHLNADFKTSSGGVVTVEVKGQYDRPGLEVAIRRALASFDLNVEGEAILSSEENGFRIKFRLKNRAKNITLDKQARVLAAIRQIPDIPQGERTVELRITISGSFEADISHRVRALLATGGINLKDISLTNELVQLRVSVPEGAGDTVQDILEGEFPSNEMEVEFIKHPLGQKGGSQGSWFAGKFYSHHVAWWLETPVLFLGLYYIHEPLTALLWGMPVLAGLLYPFLFVLGHVFNPRALKGRAVWELVGWKGIISLLLLTLEPSGIASMGLSLAVAGVTLRHKMINQKNNSLLPRRWASLLFMFVSPLAFALGGEAFSEAGLGLAASELIAFLSGGYGEGISGAEWVGRLGVGSLLVGLMSAPSINAESRTEMILRWLGQDDRPDVDREKLHNLVRIWREMFSVIPNAENKTGDRSNKESDLNRLIHWFSQWEFDESDPNLTDLRTKLLELSLLLENLNRKGNEVVLADLNRISGGNVTLERLESAMGLLAEAIGEKQSVSNIRPDKSTRKSATGLSLRPEKARGEATSRIKTQLNNLFASTQSQEDLVNRVNQFIKGVELNDESLGTLSKEIAKLLRSKNKIREDNRSIAIAIRRWSETLLVIVRMEDNAINNPSVFRLITNRDGRKHYISYYNAANSQSAEPGSNANLNLLRDIKNRLRTNKTLGLNLLKKAKARLQAWDISDPLPMKTVEKGEIVDLDALVQQEQDLLVNPALNQQRGFFDVSFSIAVVLVSAIVVVLFLPGVSFGFESIVSHLNQFQDQGMMGWVLGSFLINLSDVQFLDKIPGGSAVFLNGALLATIAHSGTKALVPKRDFNGIIQDAVNRINDIRLNFSNVYILNTLQGGFNSVRTNGSGITSIFNRGQLLVFISDATLDEWRNTKPGDLGYLEMMVETVLRRELLAKEDGVPGEDLDSLGLSIEGVNVLFKKGANLLQVGKMIRARYSLARASKLSTVMESSDQGRAAQVDRVLDDVFPPIQPLSRIVTLGDVRRNSAVTLKLHIDGLLTLSGGKPDKIFNRNWTSVFNGGESSVLEYLEGLRGPTDRVRVARSNLARDILRTMSENLASPTKSIDEAKKNLSSLYGLVGSLHILGGTLSQADTSSSESEVETGELFQSDWQELDIRLLGELGAVLLNNQNLSSLAEILDIAARSYDEARWKGVRFRNSNEAVGQALAGGGDILFHVTKNMVAPNTELSASERTQLEMIRRLASLLSPEQEMKTGKIYFLVEGELGEGERIDETISALELKFKPNRSTQSPLKYLREKQGIELKSLVEKDEAGQNKYMEIAGEKTMVDAEKLLDEIKPNSPTLFRVKQNNVEWNLGSWEDKLVAILAIMGRLVINQPRQIEKTGREGAERKRFLSYQA